ncbi:MAG TPA: cysteine desulfurase, partial [Candidatus Campbellbacteria bacterium]|nr:cysteine desulfurase [Candidatus Campbellbacteria bacterium]
IEEFGNPSALYKEGREARKAVETARADIAETIGARAEEIIFTNGGTESDNLAIFGVAYGASRKLTSLKTGITGNLTEAKLPAGAKNFHIITTKFEHHAVLKSCEALEKQSFDVTYINVGEDGIVNPKDVEKALRPETILVSIMYANNEIGTIQPIAEIAKVIKNYKKKKLEIRNSKLEINGKTPFFHSDACQASEYLDLNVEKLGVDLMTVNGSKMYGPKGIGFLYAKRGVKLSPLLYGGGQEKHLWPGTENVPAIIGLAEAIKIAQREKGDESERVGEMRDYFIKRLLGEVPKTFLNGNIERRLPNNINVSVLGIEGEAVVLYLDEYGIACSTGSACTSENFEPSHVILALGKPHAYAHGSIRFTLGKCNSKKDVDYTADVLKNVVEKLRSISAVNIK